MRGGDANISLHMITKRTLLIIVVAIGVVIAASFLLRKPVEAPTDEFFDATSEIQKETQNIEEEKAGTETTLSYTGRPLNEVRLGAGFSGSDEIVELKRKSLEEHIAEIQKDPNNVDAWLGIGTIKKFFNDYEGARDVWEYTARTFPNHPLNFANLGNLYGWYLNDSKKAVSNYSRAITLSPFEPNYYLDLAEFYLYVDTADNTNVVKVISDGMANNPRDINLPLFLASYYKSTGETASAIKYFEKVLELAPNTPGVQEEIDALNKITNQP